MSVIGTYVGNLTPPVALNLAGATLTDVLVATDDSLTVASFAFANDTAGAVVCYLEWVNAKTGITSIIWEGSVPTKDTRIISDIPIRLRDGDKIQAIGAANVRITLFCMLNFALTRQ